MIGCEFCDEKGLPCLLCGAATMRHQFDRGRCGSCASANRPQREWPVFRFCPYCGRDLGNKTPRRTPRKEKQEETDMERYIWTADQDEVIRGMILEGKTVADICDRMGCTDTQLKNHVAVVRRRDPSFPTLCGEVKGERFVLASSEATEVLSGEPQQIVVGPADEGTVEPIEETETQEKKAELNPLEKQMADIIAEQKETIDNMRVELETEQEARELEAAAYRNETKRLTDLVKELRGTVSAQGDELAAKDKLIEKVYGDLEEARKARDGALEELEQMRSGEIGTQKAAAEIQPDPLAEEFLKLNDELCKAMDEVANLSDAQHERDEVIFAMAKAIFLGPKEVLLA